MVKTMNYSLTPVRIFPILRLKTKFVLKHITLKSTLSATYWWLEYENRAFLAWVMVTQSECWQLQSLSIILWCLSI